MGKIGDKETENEVLLLEHDIPSSKFSDAVLADLPKNDWCITPEVIYIVHFLIIVIILMISKNCLGIQILSSNGLCLNFEVLNFFVVKVVLLHF